MSTNYCIEIRRKEDDKLLATFEANIIKNIVDYEYRKKLNISDNIIGSKFVPDDLMNLEEYLYEKLDNLYSQIFEKKLMILNVANTKIKEAFEQDIYDLKYSDREDIINAIAACEYIYGSIKTLVEDLWYPIGIATSDNVFFGYQYNAKELPKKTVKSLDGIEREYDRSIWIHDVYCVIKE